MDRYFEIQHFIHPEHPLILIDLKDSKTRGLINEARKKINREKQGSESSESADDVSIWCVLCGNEMLDSTSYSCIDCDIHLHKLCAKLPTEMMHPSHHEHPLTLTDHHRSFLCGICPKESGNEFSSELKNGFSYYCRSCDFDVDVKCASKREAIKHKGHPHPLYPVLRTALFKCDACGTKHSAAAGGVSYMCDTCDFWVHEDCATLPATVTYCHHVHPLSLVFHRPSFTRTALLYWNCLICKEDILGQWKQKWYYECGTGCRHQVHTICLATTLIAERNKTYEEDPDIDVAKLFRLQESFKYDDLVAQMIKHMTGENTALSKVEGPVISHFSHKHPLTLICNDDRPSIINKEDVLCIACVLPVSTPQVAYYSCTECNNYALHEWCAKLPIELLQHPAHPHPLFLQGPDHEIFGVTQYCPACGRYHNNGFSYRCRRRDTACTKLTQSVDACRRFAMDIKCLLPPAILHKAHKHPLKLVKNCFNEGCVACRYRRRELAYGCVSCCFYLHHTCALKPIAIVHRYDKHHPFTSTSVEPVENRADDDEYVCEFCEKHIDPNWWFHHCLDCDLSACSECIFPEHGGRSHLNPHLTYSSPVHHHPLSYVKLDRTNKNSLCALCTWPIHSRLVNQEYVLQCAQCKVMFHTFDCSLWRKSPKSVYPLVLQEGPSCH